MAVLKARSCWVVEAARTVVSAQMTWEPMGALSAVVRVDRKEKSDHYQRHSSLHALQKMVFEGHLRKMVKTLEVVAAWIG